MPIDLCLNMIVRNEAPVIEQTLSSIVEHFSIRNWVIHDTGSTDDTRGIVGAFFHRHNIPGRLVEKEWQNFGANRELALRDAEGTAEYVLFFDADNRVEGRLPTIEPGHDAYSLLTRRGSTVYPTKLIVRNDGRYRWRGVVHEGLYSTPAFRDHRERATIVDGDYVIESRSVGARSQDPGTYYRDARLLKSGFENIADEDRDLLPRYAFYCANSWRDAQAPHEAIEWYRRRIALGGWKDEVYLSHLGLGLELDKINDRAAAIRALLEGHEVCPDRAECLYHLARLHRLDGKFHTALLFAEAGLACPKPDVNRLFVWQDVYKFWLDFEFLFALKSSGRIYTTLDRAQRFFAGPAPDHLKKLLL